MFRGSVLGMLCCPSSPSFIKCTPLEREGNISILGNQGEGDDTSRLDSSSLQLICRCLTWLFAFHISWTMASAALIFRKKVIPYHLHNISTHTLYFGPVQSTMFQESQSAYNTSTGTPFQDKGSKKHDESVIFSALSLFRSSCCANLGPRTDPLFVRCFSTNSHDRSFVDGDHKHESAKKVAESSEDGDPADSSGKETKDNPKRLKTLCRVWSILLGVGPALRVVALMIRKAWEMEMIDMKIAYYGMRARHKLGIDILRADVSISLRLMVKMSRGMSLSRRERQLLTRATADIFRRVPGAIYIVIPSIELLLPVILRLFPGILPLTLKDKIEEQEPAMRKLRARGEFARFLHDTASEMVKVVQDSRSGEIKPTAEEFIKFATKVLRRSHVSIEEVLGFSKLFSDDLTVYNIGRPMLVDICKCMGVTPWGTDEYLRFSIQERLKFIKEDDKLLQAKGVESLSEAELGKACGERGIDVAEDMRQQLRDWLDLSLNHSLSSSILFLSRACNVTGDFKPVEAVLHVLYTLPYELKHLVMASLPCKYPINDKLIKLESLHLQEKLIKEEEEEKELLEMEKADAIEDGGLDQLSA